MCILASKSKVCPRRVPRNALLDIYPRRIGGISFPTCSLDCFKWPCSACVGIHGTLRKFTYIYIYTLLIHTQLESMLKSFFYKIRVRSVLVCIYL